MNKAKYRMKRHEVTQPQDQSYRIIPLTKGQKTIVDTADFEWLNEWNWSAYWNKNNSSYYAMCRSHPFIYMQRAILNCQKGEFADHKNRDTLDNRRQNLRKCTSSQNAQNRIAQKSNKSGYKGVYLEGKKWRGSVTSNGKRFYTGRFLSAREAAFARDKIAIEIHGDYANLNKII